MPNAERVTLSLQFGIFSASPLGPALSVLGEYFPSIDLKNLNQRSPVQWQATGQLGDLTVEVQSSPSRIDLIAAAAISEIGDPTISRLDLMAADEVLRPIANSLASKNNAHRLACIIQSITDCETGVATVELARSFIPGLLVPAGASEVDYKVNVPRKAKVDASVTLNRHHRWASILRGGIFIESTGAATQQAHSWSLLEVVDINTSSEVSLAADSRASMLDEVTDEAHQFNRDGYAAFERLDI